MDSADQASGAGQTGRTQPIYDVKQGGHYGMSDHSSSLSYVEFQYRGSLWTYLFSSLPILTSSSNIMVIFITSLPFPTLSFNAMVVFARLSYLFQAPMLPSSLNYGTLSCCEI
jgi:hypothetical protein